MKYLKLLIILFSIIIFTTSHVNSTGQPKDELDFSSYLNAKTNAEKIDVFYYDFIWETSSEHFDADTLLYYIQDIYSIGVKEKNFLPISYASFTYGRYLYNKEKYDDAEQWLLYTIKTLEGRDRDSLLIEPISLLGNIYYYQGELTNAKQFHEKAIEHGKIVSKKTGDLKFEMFVKLNLSKIDIVNGNYDEGIKKAQETIDFFSKLRAFSKLANAYGIIGEAYMSKNDHPKAIENFIKSMKYGLDTDNNIYIANAYTNLGIAEFYSNNSKLTEEYFKLALKYRIKDGSIYRIAESYYNLGDYYTTREEPQYLDSALNNYYKTIEYAEKGELLGLKKEALQQIANVRGGLGQKKIQDEILKEISELEKILLESEKESRNTTTKFGFKQNNIEMIDTSEFQSNSIAKNQSLISNLKINGIILVSNLLILLLVIFYISKRRKRGKIK